MIEEKISSKEEKKLERKKLKDLDFSDNFIFTRIMLDKEICLEVASAFLEYDISDLSFYETEKTLDVAYDSKSVRFDCFVKSEKKIINIEMQVNAKSDIVFRARYYHAIIDMDCLTTGEDYINLPESYVIFVCKYDPFKKGLVKYHFKNYDKEAKIFEDNKVHTVYYNTKALSNLKEGKLKEILKLVEKIPSNDLFSLKLKNKINEIKSSVKWQREYMKHSADLMDEKREGIAIGEAKGIAAGTEKTKLENARNLLDVLDDETIAEKIEIDIEIVKKLRLEQ